jgi:hypothetical protein
MRRFTLLSRPGCHLCEDFETEVMLRFDGLLEVETVQIDHHPVWLAKYGQQIPVLLDAAGAFVCAIEPDPDAIADALR